MPYTKAIIAGTDNIVPVYDPDGRWQIWNKKEIFIGYEGKNKYVPKLGDYVVDTELNEWFVVISVDTTTYLSELSPIEIPPIVARLDDKKKIDTTYRICPDETYRVYLDTSVMPYTLTVDSVFNVYGSSSHHVILYRGTNIEDKTHAVSMIYDQHGRLLDQAIPLELAITPGLNNHTVKVVPPCHTTVAMQNGEIVTLVVYNDQGGVVYITEMLVENTSAIRQRDSTIRYITDITLDTIFLSNTDPMLVLYPNNVPVRGTNFFLVVHYSDGAKRKLPIDGSKCRLLGLNDFVATQPSQEAKFTVRYALDTDEIAVGVSGGHVSQTLVSNRFITKTYKLQVVHADDAYSVKLYAYPVWVDDLNGYRLTFYLTSLERSFLLDVTEHVRYNVNNTIPFNGLLFGISQTVSVSINLKDAMLTAKDYIHTQVFRIQLQRQATDKTGYPWSVGFEINQFPYYGQNNFAHLHHVSANIKRLNISLEERSFKVWLDRIYYRTKPMYDPEREGGPLEPNLFKIITPYREYLFPIKRWRDTLEINDLTDELDNIYVAFIRRTHDTDLYLSVAGLPILTV